MNCTARVADGGCEMWVPTQSPTLAQRVAAEAAGVRTRAVKVHMTFLGGGFGRRSWQLGGPGCGSLGRCGRTGQGSPGGLRG
jgi:xanthine dehydrogenase molybdopterin-binding subunit B